MSEPLETKVSAIVLGGVQVIPTIGGPPQVLASTIGGIAVNAPLTGGIEVFVDSPPAIEVAAQTTDGVQVNATAEGGAAVIVGIGVTPSGLVLQTNGVINGSQALLNLVAGTNITLTDNGLGSVTIDATGGGAGGITALTGDGTATGPGSAAFTLATVNANVGTFGSVTKAVIFTVNAKGLVTAASESTIAPAVGSITGLGAGVGVALAIATNASGGVLTVGGGVYEVPLAFSTGLTRTVNTVTVNASQSITTLSNLTSNGLVTTSGGVGTLGVTVPGTGVLTALAVNVGTAGSIVVNGGALGTPSSGVGTNLTALTAANITASTTVGRNLLNLTNPSAITFIRINADNSVDALSAANFRTAIGAGTGGGDVVGPGSATDGAWVLYDGTTGKLVKDGAVPSATAVGLGNVTNDAQTKAAVVPNTTPVAGQILVGNALSTAYAPVSVSGDITMTSAGVTSIGNNKVTGAMINLTSNVAGDIMYYDGTDWVRLAKDAGKYLLSGASAVSWGVPAGTGDVSGPATNSADYIPQWNGANSKLLKNGYPISNGAGNTPEASTIVITSSGGQILLDASKYFQSGNATLGDTVRVSSSGISFFSGASVTSISCATFGLSITLPTVSGTLAVVSGPLGTPTSLTLTNATGLPIAGYALPAGYLIGLTITSDATDAVNDIDIEAGTARNSADTANMTATALVKQQDAVWAVGTNAGGMYQSANLAGTITTVSTTAVVGTGTAFTTDFVVGDVIASVGGNNRRIVTITNDTNIVTEAAMGTETAVTYKRGGKAPRTAYFIYLIRRSDTGVIDAFFTTRNPAQTVTLPTSYDSSRLIGGFHNNLTPAVDGAFNTDGFTASGYQTINYTNTLATNVDTGMFFYGAANEKWTFEFSSIVTSGAAGSKVQITAPTSATTEAMTSTIADTNGSNAKEITAINTLTAQMLANAAGTNAAKIYGGVTISSTAGVVALGAASVTATQTTTVKGAGSIFTARRR